MVLAYPDGRERQIDPSGYIRYSPAPFAVMGSARRPKGEAGRDAGC